MIIKAVGNHVVGSNHKVSHRMWCGVVFMAVGVAVAKSSGLLPYALFHYSVDMVGYAIHGLGCTPFITYLVETA